jgi:S-adenosylmethionine-diacylglycerol 3-amino-3-carboxypropyl transferase
MTSQGLRMNASPSAAAPPFAADAEAASVLRRRRRPFKAAHDYLFRRVHGGTLIYNTCWEDPRIDRALLRLDADSRVVMITSAGCNALEYLLDDPAEIHAVDLNPRQNALFELKRAMLRHSDHARLWSLFGEGADARHAAIYGEVRGAMPAEAAAYWDRRIRYFDPGGRRNSFYYHGGSGFAAHLLRAVLGGGATRRRLLQELLEAPDLASQRRVFAELEPAVWGRMARWLVRQPMLMALLGVPRPQIRLIEESHPGGLGGYVRDKLRRVMTELPIRENYFWRVYLNGRYSPQCCPAYLRPKHFETLAARVIRVQTHTTSLTSHLRRHPGPYSHFVLLDHQDWLAAHDPAALLEEWEAIVASAAPGAKVLMRSAGLDLSFVPAAVRSRLTLRPDLAEPLHATDRVGTYGSLHLAEIP